MVEVINSGIFDVIRYTILCTAIWPYFCMIMCVKRKLMDFARFYAKFAYVLIAVFIGMCIIKYSTMVIAYVSTN